MALSSQELATLNYFCTDHNYLAPFINSQDWSFIESWFTQVPTPTLNFIVSLLSPYEKHRFFSIISFPEWYSSYCLKVHQQVDLTPLSVIPMPDPSFLLDSIVSLIIQYGLTAHTMLEIVSVSFKREYKDLIQVILISLASDGVIYEDTLLHINVETSPFPRWQSLSLSSSPSSSELQSVL